MHPGAGQRRGYGVSSRAENFCKWLIRGYLSLRRCSAGCNGFVELIINSPRAWNDTVFHRAVKRG